MYSPSNTTNDNTFPTPHVLQETAYHHAHNKRASRLNRNYRKEFLLIVNLRTVPQHSLVDEPH